MSHPLHFPRFQLSGKIFSSQGNTADATPYEKLLKSIDIKQGEAETLIKRYRKANHDQKRTENPEDRPKVMQRKFCTHC